MPGTKAGSRKSKETIEQKYGKDYWKNLGKKGGSVRHPETRYFTTNRAAASICGYKGGKISKRGPKKKEEE